MSVIKPAQNPPARAFRVEDLDELARVRMEEARRQADALVAAARTEAAAILAAAAAERQAASGQGFEAGKAQGAEKGRAEGREAAFAEEKAALAPESARVEAALTSVRAALADAGRRASVDAEAAVLQLALSIARIVVKREVALDESVVRANVERATALAARREGIEVRVNPGDYESVKAWLPELAARMDGHEVASLVSDSAVERGGCRVIAAKGSVDAEIATQLREIERALLGNGR